MVLGLPSLRVGNRPADPHSVEVPRLRQGRKTPRGSERSKRFCTLLTAAKTTRGERWKSQNGFFYSLGSRDKCSCCFVCLRGPSKWARRSRPPPFRGRCATRTGIPSRAREWWL